MKRIREDNTYKNVEREKDRLAKNKRRLDEGTRSQEREQNREAMQRRRLNEDLRSQEREHDRTTRQQRRLDEDLRSQDREQNRAAMQRRRETPMRAEERERDRESRARTRGDPVRRRIEFDAVNSRRNEREWDKLLQEFKTEIRRAPVHPCTSCGCIYYPDNIKTMTADEIPNEIRVEVLCLHTDAPQFCGTCKRHISKGKIPPLCLSNGLAFPDIPPSLQVCIYIFYDNTPACYHSL